MKCVTKVMPMETTLTSHIFISYDQ